MLDAEGLAEGENLPTNPLCVIERVAADKIGKLQTTHVTTG
jgi:hypothetical protein